MPVENTFLQLEELRRQAVAEINQHLIKSCSGDGDDLETSANRILSHAVELAETEHARHGRMLIAEDMLLQAYRRIEVSLSSLPNVLEFPELQTQLTTLTSVIIVTNLTIPAAMVHIHSEQKVQFQQSHRARLVKLFTDANVTYSTAAVLADHYEVKLK